MSDKINVVKCHKNDNMKLFYWESTLGTLIETATYGDGYLAFPYFQIPLKLDTIIMAYNHYINSVTDHYSLQIDRENILNMKVGIIRNYEIYEFEEIMDQLQLNTICTELSMSRNLGLIYAQDYSKKSKKKNTKLLVDKEEYFLTNGFLDISELFNDGNSEFVPMVYGNILAINDIPKILLRYTHSDPEDLKYIFPEIKGNKVSFVDARKKKKGVKECSRSINKEK